MNHVSTAFVGQVSAARSPAIAKLKGRARATNDAAYVPLASSPSRAVALASRPDVVACQSRVSTAGRAR